MSQQQEISRATVERLLVELAATADPAHAEAVAQQIRLHAELAGLDAEAVAKLATPAPKAKPKAEA